MWNDEIYLHKKWKNCGRRRDVGISTAEVYYTVSQHSRLKMP